ncbi:transcriptional regulator with XRE-family HTH domain [Nesterenkonia lutea]|uniref:Transcriptional regulator with XRE-family HTH domain n=1 Tax=Nesterenkonia lutea TaxID=272919 RepID=A0ABR9JFC3_9MICC|nr:transcriptional regulator with XRE-family HTH domain [Nesterenkonia lutea]
MTGMSSDYYSRTERGHSPKPSEQMVTALARGLRLSLDDRDYLFQVVGYGTAPRVRRTDHVNVGLMRVVDRLTDTPAIVLNSLGETLFQTQPGLALLGDQRTHQGLARSVIYRWFTNDAERKLYPVEEHPKHSRVLASQLREVLTREGPRSRAADIVDALQGCSTEFTEVWAEHVVGWRYSEQKILLHPELGELTVYCQSLLDPEQIQTLLVFTATPGTESHDKLQLLSVIGTQKLSPSKSASV